MNRFFKIVIGHIIIQAGLLFSIPNCWADVVYVSSSIGKDTNIGNTPEAPLKTIMSALSKADTVLLKSGDVFYESIDIRKGLISVYGGDTRPILSGYKRLINPRWQKVGNNLWTISLSDDNFVGFNTNGSSFLNNIGCIHEWDKNLIHGRKLQFRHQLNEDWDIWQTEHHSSNDARERDFDSLYLYLHGDPNKLKLEFSSGSSAAKVSNATLDFLHFEGFGFGLSVGAHSTVRNCRIDAIGGKIQFNDREYVCYGNGIELWIVKGLTDCLVEKNIISRCYDCACTIQGRTDSPRNIRISNNTIVDCCQGWEDFLTNANPDIYFDNCYFENNTIINSGKTSGFGYPDTRFKYCHVLSGNVLGNKGMIIRNNTFVGGNYFCSASFNGAYKSTKWWGNTCIISRGNYILSNYLGTKDVIRIPTERGRFRSLTIATEEAIKRYRELTGDETTKFVIKSEKRINRRILKVKKQYLMK